MATATAAAEAGHEAAKGGMPQLDFSTFPNQIFWLVVAMVALYLIFSRKALPQITGIIENRAATITGDLDKAADFKRQSVDAEAAYKAALEQSRAEAQRIGAETKAAIKVDLDKAIAKADAEIAAQAAESEKRIQQIRANALASVETVAKDTARAIVEAIMPSAADDKSVDAAVVSRLKGA